jgi:ABC-type tungstate transport system permease subunit/ABC-type tungstate transport system substrate-binding protein
MQIIQRLNIVLILCSLFSLANAETETLRLAITTTTENSGLMSVLNPVFESENNVKINAVIVGSGQALQLGKQGDVDVLLTHAPEDEKQFVRSGYGLKRYPVMHNEFVLVGPAADPAKTKNASSAFDAFNNIYTAGNRFISRADDSGTHKKELSLWEENKQTPKADWYIRAGMGMGSVLLLANEQSAYTLTDRGTYLAFKDKIDLDIHYQGGSVLHNPYHVIAVNPERHPYVNNDLTEKYINFITGDKAQKIIKDHKIFGEQLFYPEAVTENIILEENSVPVSRNFFLDATISSFNLIVNFDRALFHVVWTSLKVSLIAVLIATLLSIPLGVVVALNNFTGKNFLMTCLNTLMALPTVVVGLLLYGILNRQGMLGSMSLLYTPVAIIIGQCVLIIPVIWNLCIAAVNSADPRLAMTCTSLGANYFQRSLIYMSEVRFALIAAVVTGFGRAIGEVGIAMMLGGNIHGYTRTMTTAIALETSKGDFEFALALGVMLLLVAFIINSVLQQFQLKIK